MAHCRKNAGPPRYDDASGNISFINTFYVRVTGALIPGFFSS